MSIPIGLLNRFLNMLFGLICAPFAKLAPIWALVFISLVTGVLMLWIFGKVSNQKSIQKIKDKIRGNLIGVRLFQDDIGVVMRLQGRILLDALIYMKYALIPMLIMMIPVVLIMIQLNLRFAVKPLEAGQPTLVKATVQEGVDLGLIDLEVPEGVVVETPAVKIPSKNEITWRIRPEKDGDYEIRLGQGDDAVTKQLLVGSSWGAVSPIRTGLSASDMLLWPGEAPIEPNLSVQRVEVLHPALPLMIFGWDINWIIIFFVLSIVFGFAFKDLLGVQI